MPTPYELEKARLACFITELQDLIDGHQVSDGIKTYLHGALDYALNELQYLEHLENHHG